MAAAGFADRLDNAFVYIGKIRVASLESSTSIPALYHTPRIQFTTTSGCFNSRKGEDNDSCSADTYSASKDSMYG